MAGAAPLEVATALQALGVFEQRGPMGETTVVDLASAHFARSAHLARGGAAVDSPLVALIVSHSEGRGFIGRAIPGTETYGAMESLPVFPAPSGVGPADAVVDCALKVGARTSPLSAEGRSWSMAHGPRPGSRRRRHRPGADRSKDRSGWKSVIRSWATSDSSSLTLRHLRKPGAPGYCQPSAIRQVTRLLDESNCGRNQAAYGC